MHPVVLSMIDAIGLRARIEQVADRIAGQGNVVLAPNVLTGAGGRRCPRQTPKRRATTEGALAVRSSAHCRARQSPRTAPTMGMTVRSAHRRPAPRRIETTAQTRTRRPIRRSRTTSLEATCSAVPWCATYRTTGIPARPQRSVTPAPTASARGCRPAKAPWRSHPPDHRRRPVPGQARRHLDARTPDPGDAPASCSRDPSWRARRSSWRTASTCELTADLALPTQSRAAVTTLGSVPAPGDPHPMRAARAWV